MEASMMSHVVKMATGVMEAVVVSHKFIMGKVLLLFQTGKKCRSHNVRCTNFYDKGRFI